MKPLKFRAWDGFSMTEPFVMGSVFAENSVDYDWEVMQFTGLVDRFGNDIYEGDLLQQNVNSKVMEVVWTEGKFIVRGTYDGELAFYASSCSIIGNIYANPELL